MVWVTLLCCIDAVFHTIAYLTNPTENSFRAYLTEQSFRQHLSRLDDNVDEDQKQQTNSGSRYPYKRSYLATAHALSFDNSSPFHFANRASVSLRTPKHVFHSFGLFTIAAMVPLARSTRTDERDALMISDSWYVGAFGRWWRGGIIEAWYQDVIARSKDEESWSSGILSMKNLDMLNEYNGTPPPYCTLFMITEQGIRPPVLDQEPSTSSPFSWLPPETKEPRQIVTGACQYSKTEHDTAPLAEISVFAFAYSPTPVIVIH